MTTTDMADAAIQEATDADGALTLQGVAKALLRHAPQGALDEAARLGPLTEEERRGDVEAERRVALHQARARLWWDTIRNWPDDDMSEASLERLDRNQRPSRIRAWLANPAAQILILSGDTGRGKTYAAFAAGTAAVIEGRYVRAVSHKRYLDALEPDGSDVPDWQTRRWACNAEVLIVDDLGSEMDPMAPASEFRTRETCDLLSARMRPGKKTVITTNLTPDELGTMFGGRIVSRLKQGSTALPIQGEDRRALGATWG